MRDIRNDLQDRVGSMATPFAGLAPVQGLGGMRGPASLGKNQRSESESASLTKLLSSLGIGDTLVVTRLDRLARSTFDLLNIVKSTAAKDANFLSLAEPWANTSTAIGKLMLGRG
jgi:hypothetical protein